MRRIALGGLAAALVSVTAVSAAPAARHIRGTIASVGAGSMTVTTATGTQTVALGPKTAFAGVVPGTIADVKSGTFIGAANVPSAGAARALEVVVFPASMAGLGEGDYPWDLPAGGHQSAMTNGTVGMGGGSSMTNGTVGSTAGGGTKTVHVSYKGGSKTLTITPGTPIVRVIPGTRAFVTPGAKVFVIPSAAGPAGFVVVGREGAVPPM